MGDRETRSPISTSGNTARTGNRGPGVSPLSSRADAGMGGHLLRHVGKNSVTPEALVRKPPPPVGRGF
jgi:hypothetical protein